MAAPKGHKKWGGRKKGDPNKKTEVLQDKAKELGIDPFEILLHFANGDWEALGYKESFEYKYTPSGARYMVDVIPAELRCKAAADACQYLHPKRKAIDHTDMSRPWENRPNENVTDEELRLEDA